MSKVGSTFSESWHRIANLKISLRPTVEVRKQYFRSEKWYVLHDPFNNSFFRLRPEAYDFVSRLRPDRTVEEVWEECLALNPNDAPGQEDVLQLLTQLFYSNILYFEMAADSAKLFERYSKRRQRELRSRLLSIMFVRIPLLDPDRMLNRLKPLWSLATGKAGLLLWLLVVGLAAKVVVEQFDQVTMQAQGVLAPDNLILLYIGMFLVKTLHEFGHAVICKKFGGEVHTMGVMLLVFTPLPYVDATSSWRFRSRWQRALVGAAGMVTEVFIAALATLYWANSAPGVLHSLSYNIMFIASVSTVLFNANPLLRFDGYYILSDLLDVPNLHTRSLQHLRHLVEYYLFGYQESSSPTRSMKEAFWLTVFGILSGIYRVVVFVGIIFFVADKFLLAGLIMALVCVVSWGIVPPYRLVKYLASSPRLARTRLRAVSICLVSFLGLIFFLGVCPFPHRFRAPGILESVDHLQVVSGSPGYVEKILTETGVYVTEGTPLLKLVNREIEIEQVAARAQWDEVLALEKRATSKQAADLEPIRKRKEAISEKLRDLEIQLQNLTVRAQQAGVWVAPKLSELPGVWVIRGGAIGEIVNPGEFRFSAVVPQEEASNLFIDQITRAEVRLYGQEGENIEVKKFQIIPFQHEKLPSAALGWLGGGEVAVSLQDESGLKTTEPFFQIYADLIPVEGVKFLHGRSGKIRFSLHPEPLLWQGMRLLRQLLQKRYQI